MDINEISEGGTYNFAKKGLFCPWSGIQFDETFAIWESYQIERKMYFPQDKVRTWKGKTLEETSVFCKAFSFWVKD